MLFSSMLFLWLFLPIVFIGYRLIDAKYRNLFLLVSSLLFYAWGEPKFVLIMLVSISINFGFGLLINRADRLMARRIFLALCAITNISILGYFKYYNFFARNVNAVFGADFIGIKDIILPIGISFYTFQALSYVIDIYRNETPVLKNILDLALYISFFPQLIAGPIVKYHDIRNQIKERTLTALKTTYGIKRFIYGLSKKVILANTFAQVVDQIYTSDVSILDTYSVWIAAILYTLQIYYDFSGYSDMAIGLGKMFGFDFQENFNYPYVSKSVKDFWRRWHISLSTWFKQYLYIPLGGNRKSNLRTYGNLLIVFFVTGLWHGASYNFIFWGIYHGFFLSIERLFLGKILRKNKLVFINYLYTISVVLIGWVLFRAQGLIHALNLLKVMFVFTPRTGLTDAAYLVGTKVWLLVFVGVLFCGFVQSTVYMLKAALFNEHKVYLIENIVLFSLLFIDIMLLVNSMYNPFIYFRF